MTVICTISERPYSLAPLASICLNFEHGLTAFHCTYTEIQIEHELRDIHLSLRKNIALGLIVICSGHN